MIKLNGKGVKIKKFPNGESLIKTERLELKEGVNNITVRFENDKDITHLIFLKGHLDDLGIKTSLYIPYLPYSRMDRTEGVTVFTLKHLCKLINSLEFEEVTVCEPHSDVCVALINRVRVVNTSQHLAEVALKEISEQPADLNKLDKPVEQVYIVYPDAGAEKRYSKQIDYDKILTASKERDFKTGDIKRLDIHGEVTGAFKAIIVDDLCSKGGTFMLTASKLKEMGATDIYLVVTHCENTIFNGSILTTDLIKKVYTTNSIVAKENEKLDIMKIF